MMHWAAKYVGVPYLLGGDSLRGADCWGLVRLVLWQERGLEMPAVAVKQRDNLRALRRCFDGWQACDGRAPFDIVTMRGAFGHHVGIVAKSEKGLVLLLHCDEPHATIARLSDMRLFGYSDFRAWRHG